MEYVIAGLTLGGIYALVAATVVVTYAASGVLNFAVGAQAYFVARLFYFLNTQKNWATLEAALVCILIVSPLIGLSLRVVLFQFLQSSSTLTKIVATIGLAVALPPAAALLFGNVAAYAAPGLAPVPVHVYTVFGTAITLDQVIVLVSVASIVLIGFLLVRYTEVGLAVRATVESRALSSISGTNTRAVSMMVWSVTSLLTGLAGILVAPIIQLNSDNFSIVLASAFAAVIVARMAYVGRAVLVGVLVGVAGGVIQGREASSGSLATGLVNSLPFAVTVVALLWYGFRGQTVEGGPTAGFLDRAIATKSDRTAGRARLSSERSGLGRPVRQGKEGRAKRALLVRVQHRMGGFALLAIIVVALPLILKGQWVAFFATGLAYGVVFLSYTLLTGEGGMIWLCQITFAGIGGVSAAQLSTVYHWPVLVSLVAGGGVAVVFGAVIGLLAIRLGDLYVALATLTFGVLMDNLVFVVNRFYQDGIGVALSPPRIAGTDVSFTYLVLVCFCVIALAIVAWRRSTAGLKLTAVRWSEPASTTLGISVVKSKVLVGALSAFIAGVGGGLLAMASGSAIPTEYATLGGLVWFAVLVTLGARSIVAAMVAGLSFALMPAVFLTYVPSSFLQVPTLLFGLGAVLLARNPEGSAAVMGRSLERLLKWGEHDSEAIPSLARNE